jgi:hypothetical protein
LEAHELFEGWGDYPPTSITLKGLAAGFGVGVKENKVEDDGTFVPTEAQEAMQRSAMQAIAAKAGARLPIMRSRDPGLPKAKPVFDLDELRRKNAEAILKRIKGSNGVRH